MRRVGDGLLCQSFLGSGFLETQKPAENPRKRNLNLRFADVAERGKITKSQVQMWLLLDDYRYNRPEIFRSYLQITPKCFDDLVAAIADDEVFHNNAKIFSNAS